MGSVNLMMKVETICFKDMSKAWSYHTLFRKIALVARMAQTQSLQDSKYKITSWLTRTNGQLKFVKLMREANSFSRWYRN